MNSLVTLKEIANYLNMLHQIKFMISSSLDWANFYCWWDNWEDRLTCIDMDEI